MTKTTLKLIAHFLEYAYDRMGNAGCNDFPEFAGFFESKEDQFNFCKAMEDWNSEGRDFDPDDLDMPDFFVVDYLKHLVEQEIERP